MESKKKAKESKEVKEQKKEHSRFIRKEFLFNDENVNGDLEFSIATYNILAQTYTRQVGLQVLSNIRKIFRTVPTNTLGKSFAEIVFLKSLAN